MKKKLVAVDEDLHRKLKILAAKYDVTLTSLVEEGIKTILKVAM